MKALNLYGVDDLRYDEVALPARQEDEVLLKIRAVGICGSDLARVFTKGTYHFPTIIGHEFAGEIVEAADASLIGRGAAVFPLLPCGHCEACREEHYAQCSHYDYYGSRRDGAMAEYIAVKRNNLVLMPATVSYRAAAMSEPTAVARHAFLRSGAGKDDVIIIFGIGTIALLMAAWAKKAGVRHIILAARSREKVAFAQKLGFSQVVNIKETDLGELVMSFTAGRGADVFIEGTGVAEGLEQCLSCMRNFGRVVLLGNPQAGMELSQQAYWQILRKELTLTGTWNSSFSLAGNDDWQAAMSSMADGSIDVEALITQVFPLSAYQEAFTLMRDKKELYCKVMFVND